MITDLQNAASDLDLTDEICVIGAGAVGLALAVKLARAGHKVTLLEGGGKGLETKSQELMKGFSVGHPFKHLGIGRYRVLGGSTTFWGGQVVPFDSFIFEERPWVAPSGWPISHADLRPYYDEAYALVGLSRAEMEDAKIWDKVGVSADLGDDALSLQLTRWIPQRNFAKLFRKDIDANTSLRIVTHANVTGFEVDMAGKVTETNAKAVNGRTLRLKTDRVIVACGTIETVRLLLHPLSNGQPAPWHDNPWLGVGFLDHLDSLAGEVEVIDRDRFHDLFDNIYLKGFKYYPKIRLSQAAQKSKQAVDVAAQFRFDNQFSEHLDNIKMFIRSLMDGRMPDNPLKIPAHLLAVLRVAAPLVWRYIVANRSFKPGGTRVRLALYGEQIPTRVSRIRLSPERDALGMQMVEVDWQIDGRELQAFSDFAGHVKAALERLGLANVTLDPQLEHEDPAFLSRIGDAIHQMSGARMGRNADEGVVDANLRVFGTSNLYLASAAVYPTTGFANPTFTAISLALRLADHIGENRL
ncbi:FAD-dependent oxidoreductase [Sphingomonas sp. IC081]|uniref:FAD-dependent oxidoreductase n=1 Tax=Sphingomonas sp. IC081 TaxID=304378 RepID=UPI00115B2EAC|nr:GMC family oxidoreductase [Sphingomonas sp. IC081]QDK36061.1 hypothetical protein DM450_25460 [Sphingomonas sp. IC081]